MPTDIENLQGILLGLGLTRLPQVMTALAKARHLSKNVERDRTPEGKNPDAEELHSVLAPLLQQLGMGASAAPPSAGAPPSGPGMRVGMRPPATPPMPSVPRLMSAGAGAGGL